MKSVIALTVASALGLSGCNTSLSLGSLDAGIAKASARDLPALCTLASSAHAGFATVAATGTVKASLVNSEAQAWAGANAICLNPPSNVSTAMATLANAYAAIVAARRTAGG